MQNPIDKINKLGTDSETETKLTAVSGEGGCCGG